MQVRHCNKCKKQLDKVDNAYKCVNLGCIEYNKIVRRKYANRQKRYEKTIYSQEEE